MGAGSLDPVRNVHVLAQTPDRVRLPADLPEHGRMVAEAYGVEHRVDPGAEPPPRDGSFAEKVESLWAEADAPLPTIRGDDSILDGQRVVLVTNIPAHYRAPLYELVARRVEAAGGTFEVVFLARSHPGRRFMSETDHRYPHRFARAVELPVGESHRFVPVDLEARLLRSRPTQVVAGGFSPLVAPRVAAVAASLRVPLGIFSGETPGTVVNRSWPSTTSRRWLARRAAFGLAYGSSAAAYLGALRADLPTVITRNAAPAPPPRRQRPDDEVRILAVGRLTAGKNVDVVVEAVRRVENDRLRLTVVGDGPHRRALERSASGDRRITFAGPIPSSQTLDVYRDHDIFVFPSRYDVWGLAFVEAMSAGLACVTSSSPGAAHDLAVDGANCVLVDGGPGEWADALDRLASDPPLREALGAGAARSVERRWTIEHSADAFVAALRLGARVSGGLSRRRRAGTRGSP